MTVFTTVRVREREGRGWIAEASYKDDSGKWRKRSKTLKATGKRAAQKEAEEWLADLNTEEERREAEGAALAALGLSPQSAPTVFSCVRGYIEGKSEIEPSTRNEYRRMLDKLIGPYIGDIELKDPALNTETVKAWVAKVSEQYARVTVRKALTLLRSAMRDAVYNGLALKDPTFGVKVKKDDCKRKNSLTQEGVRVVRGVLEIAELNPSLLGVKIALYTGMREGEICALRWKNVDPARGELTVEEAIGRDGSRFYLKAPKNSGSSRTVYFGNELAADFIERRKAVEAECNAAGIKFSPEMFVLGNIRGEFLRPLYLSNKWRGLASALELKGTRGIRPSFSDLRHTFATMAVAAHVDIKVISESMGHSNSAMTLNTYADATVEGKQRAAQTMQAVLTGGGEQ